MKKWLLVIVTMLPLSALANGFVGIDFVSSKVEPRSSNNDASPQAMQFKMGHWFNREQTFGAEGRIGLGLNDSRLQGNTKLEINRTYGAFVRGQFPNTVMVRPYALLGVNRIETTIKSDGGRSSDNMSDLALGFGADIDISPVIFASVEYLRAVERSNRRVSNLSFGINGRF